MLYSRGDVRGPRSATRGRRGGSFQPKWCYVHNRQFMARVSPGDRWPPRCPICKEDTRLLHEAAIELGKEGVLHPRVDQALERAEAKAGRKLLSIERG